MDNEPWHISQKLFDQLCEYLQPDSPAPASAVAERLDSLFPTHRSKEDQPDDEPVEHVKTFFWNIWDSFHIPARQLPHNSPEQEKLVACLKVIKNTTSKTPIAKIDTYHGHEEETCRLWQDLYHFEATFNEMAYLMESQKDNEEEWRNVMAYAARLTRDRTADLSSFGASSLSAALSYTVVLPERRSRPDHEVLALDFTPSADLRQKVAVAGDWIAYAGDVLFEKYSENQDQDAIHGWQFWKQRFEEMALDGDVDEQTRGLAEVAKRKMDQVEVSGEGKGIL